MFATFSTNNIDLHVAASQVVVAFNKLNKVNDSTFVPLYQTYVEVQTVVENLWPLLNKFLAQNGDTRNCEAHVQHYNVSNSVITGVYIKFISETKARQIKEENAEILESNK